MAGKYDGQAIGMFELDSLGACYVALDAAAKTANISVQGVERNRLKSGACVKIRGGISDVKAAMEAAILAAAPYGKVTAQMCIIFLRTQNVVVTQQSLWVAKFQQLQQQLTQ